MLDKRLSLSYRFCGHCKEEILHEYGFVVRRIDGQKLKKVCECLRCKTLTVLEEYK